MINPTEVPLQDHTVSDPLPGITLGKEQPFLLVEIPIDFQAIKATDIKLAAQWRVQSRLIFEWLFKAGYIVTDFVHSTDVLPHSYYVLVHGESTL